MSDERIKVKFDVVNTMEDKTPEEDLAGLIWHISHGDEGTISGTGANIIAKNLIALGYGRIPTIRLHTSSEPDMEVRAELINEGYELAMAQHIAEDPTRAEEWLSGKLHDAWKAGVLAKSNSSSIFDADVLAQNPHPKEDE